MCSTIHAMTYDTVRYCTLPCSTVLYCTVLYCIVLFVCRYLMDPEWQFVKFFGRNHTADSLADGIASGDRLRGEPRLRNRQRYKHSICTVL